MICQDLSEIDAVIDNLKLEIDLVNSYLDFDEYSSSPVKHYIDDRFEYFLLSDREKVVNAYIKDNEIELIDSYMNPFASSEIQNFISIDRVDQDLKNIEEGSIITIRFQKDLNYQSYSRSVYNVFDAFGDIGGVLEICTIFGGFLVGAFADRVFHYSIISSLYQVDSTFGDKEDQSSQSDEPNEEVENENFEENKETDQRYKQKDDKYINSTPDSSNNQSFRNRENLQARARDSMMNRRFYNYSL